jgi:hypothetical protein
MNNRLSYYGLVDARMSMYLPTSDKDLPLSIENSQSKIHNVNIDYAQLRVEFNFEEASCPFARFL